MNINTGLILKKLKALGFCQQDLAMASRLSTATVSRIMSSNKPPTEEQVNQIMDGLAMLEARAEKLKEFVRVPDEV